jgi:hypothetical protein
LQVFRVAAKAAKQCRLAPVEIGAQDQPVETVVFRSAVEDVHEAFFETSRRCLDV